jgi:hypothetical protein
MTGPQETPDGYCRQCRKMVPVELTVAGLGTRVLEIHYTFFMVNSAVDSKAKSCTGRLADNTITHFMDDPKASFE